MSEKQPTAYVVCRYRIFTNVSGYSDTTDSIPVKVFDTRREAREYCKRLNKRSKHYGYHHYSVKKG